MLGDFRRNPPNNCPHYFAPPPRPPLLKSSPPVSVTFRSMTVLSLHSPKPMGVGEGRFKLSPGAGKAGIPAWCRPDKKSPGAIFEQPKAGPEGGIQGCIP